MTGSTQGKDFFLKCRIGKLIYFEKLVFEKVEDDKTSR